MFTPVPDRVTALFWLTIAVVGCGVTAPPPRELASDDELTEAYEEISQDPRIQSLRESADKHWERLITKTGEGVKTVDWDLSAGNHLSLVRWPDDELSDDYIINQDIDLSIRFPAGFAVKERADLLICKRADRTSDRLSSVRFHLPKCTTEEAYRTTKDYITRWQLEKQRTTEDALRALDDWHADAKQRRRATLLVARHDNYPIIDLEILNSFDDARPWFISLYFSISKPPLPDDVVRCFKAIRAGDAATVTQLIDGGVDPNSDDVLGDSLLHQAAESGRADVVRFLLDRGADVDGQGGYGQTPLWEAVLDGHLDVAQLLLDHGANIDSGSHNAGTVLHYVCEYITGPLPNYTLAQWLVDRGARVDVVDNRGDSPLHKSAWKGHLAAAAVLISAGADINMKDLVGRTPLDHALNQRQTELEHLLRKHGARRGEAGHSE